MKARAERDDAGRTWSTVWADDDAQRLAAALADLGTPLLFGGAPSVVVRHAEALGADGEDRVAAALPRLDRPAQLVLVARAADQRRGLVQQLARAGAVFAFTRPVDGPTARRWVARLARERGADVAPAATDLMVERSGGDLAALEGEIEKAWLFAGPGTTVAPAHVDATSIDGRGAAIEELTDRLARRDVGAAARVLRRLLAAGEPPIKVAAFVAANLRRALHVAELADAGLDPDAVAARLGMPGWLVRKELGRGRRRAQDLESALVELRRLDLALKSSRPDAATFEAVLLRIAAA